MTGLNRPARSAWPPVGRTPPDRPSPLTSAAEWSAYGEPAAPRPHTPAELDALLRLLTRPQARIEIIAVGHSRDPASRNAADALIRAWEGLDRKTVRTVVDWPEQAASWLRPARRFAAGPPDAWVVAAAGRGWAELSRRLRRDTEWAPDRTYGFASLADPRTIAYAGQGTLNGLRGAAADGTTWSVDGNWLTGQVL
ncbi:hypothetical protein [Streptodolium elevatio]|uniref:Leucine-binding protein domain-containing protein n=1 Tax=Streptodolium elevatio TaxID=3157996 RepID=A0ABV3DAK3_9ACTN